MGIQRTDSMDAFFLCASSSPSLSSLLPLLSSCDASAVDARSWDVASALSAAAGRAALSPASLATASAAARALTGGVGSVRELLSIAQAGLSCSDAAAGAAAFHSELALYALLDERARGGGGARPLKASAVGYLLSSALPLVRRCGEEGVIADVAAAAAVALSERAVALFSGSGTSPRDLLLPAAALLLSALRACVLGAVAQRGSAADARMRAGACVHALQHVCGVDPCTLLRLCARPPACGSVEAQEPSVAAAEPVDYGGEGSPLERAITGACSQAQAALEEAADGSAAEGAGTDDSSEALAAALRSGVAALPFLMDALGTGGDAAAAEAHMQAAPPCDTAIYVASAPSLDTAAYAAYARHAWPSGAVSPHLQVLPSPLRASTQLTLLLPQLGVLLEDAAGELAAGTAAALPCTEAPVSDLGSRMSGGAAAERPPAACLLARAAVQRTGVLLQAAAVDAAEAAGGCAAAARGSAVCVEAAGAAGAAAPRPFLTRVGVGMAAWASSSSAALSAAPSGGASPPPSELRLFRALLSLVVLSPLSGDRRAAWALARGLLAAMWEAPRLRLLTALLGACPYPALMGALLDAVRGGCAQARAAPPPQAAPGALASAPSPFACATRVQVVVSAALAARLRAGLTQPPGRQEAPPEREAEAEARLLRIAQHLERWADADAALLSLVRLLLLRAAAGGAPLLAAPTLREMREGYLHPLAAALSACQRALCPAQHLMALHPHAAPFQHVPPGGAPGAARPAPPPEAATLSKLFLLDSALAPVLELVDKVQDSATALI